MTAWMRSNEKNTSFQKSVASFSTCDTPYQNHGAGEIIFTDFAHILKKMVVSLYFLHGGIFVRKTPSPPGLGTPCVPRTEAEALGRVFRGSGVGKFGKKSPKKKRFKELIILQIPHLSFGIY